MPETIDRFIPAGEVRERHETLVRAPAELVFAVAERFELESIPIVHAIFRLRAALLGARHRRLRQGLVEMTLGIGWGKLAYTPGRELVMGSVTQPWMADVKFRAVPPERFAEFDEPGMVKIAWTIEAEPIGAALTRLRTQTRVAATDESARRQFRRYWRRFSAGILMIRWLALPAMRREAERRYAGQA